MISKSDPKPVYCLRYSSDNDTFTVIPISDDLETAKKALIDGSTCDHVPEEFTEVTLMATFDLATTTTIHGDAPY